MGDRNTTNVAISVENANLCGKKTRYAHFAEMCEICGNPVAPPGFCNRGEWGMGYSGSRVRSPPVPVVLSVYQRGSFLDGLAMYLSCNTKKFHDNESTHILHNFWTSTHRGKLPPPPWRRHWFKHRRRRAEATYMPVKSCVVCDNSNLQLKWSPTYSKLHVFVAFHELPSNQMRSVYVACL